MPSDRRRILKLTGASLASAGAVGGAAGAKSDGAAAGTDSEGGAATVAAADPADEWDPAHYSNYTSANRTGADINWIVIHTTAGSYQGAKSWFKNPDANVSAHYVISKDGYATKMVAHENVAWHAGGFNSNAIGIEHEWYDGMGPVTEACQAASAEIVTWLAEQYDIPLVLRDPGDPCRYAGGIIRHRHAPVDSACSETNTTSCPVNFDFGRYMTLLDGDGGDPRFGMGDRIATTGDVWVREEPGLDGEKITVVDQGTCGEVVDGPTDADGYTWWGIRYPRDGEGLRAWTPGDWLAAEDECGPDETNVDALARILTAEAGHYITRDVERRAVGYTVINRMARQGTDDVRDVWDAYAVADEATEESVDLASDILDGTAGNPTEGATFFYSPRSMPAAGEDTDGHDVSGGLEWVPGLAERHYRPGWGRDNRQQYIEDVRPAYFKFFHADTADRPPCAGGLCPEDRVVTVDGPTKVRTKPRSFAAETGTVDAGTRGTVVGDGGYADGAFLKVRFDDGQVGYTTTTSLEAAPAFEVESASVTRGRVATGEPFTVSADVTIFDDEGTFEVALLVDDETVATALLGPDDSTVSFEHTIETTGRYAIRVEDEPAGVVVVEPASVGYYAGEDGIVDTAGLREAVEDWRTGVVNSDRLRGVIEAWGSGTPVE